MKPIYKKLFSSFAVLIFMTTLFTNLFSFEDGITGLTKRNGGIGCVCHGFGVPSSSVQVFIVMPDSVAINQTVYPKLKIVGGPHVKAGLDVAVFRGNLDTTYLEPGIQKAIYHYSITDSGYEITHTMPKLFVGDTATFTFKYKAPSTAGWDTLYANGNSVNGNSEPDTNDAWNFAANKTVRIYIPIGIENISEIANSFSLAQNYPNPFNPSTNIIISIEKESHVNLTVYDITGRLVKTLADKNFTRGTYRVTFDGSELPSGVYFYRLQADNFTETKKMLMVK